MNEISRTWKYYVDVRSQVCTYPNADLEWQYSLFKFYFGSTNEFDVTLAVF